MFSESYKFDWAYILKFSIFSSFLNCGAKYLRVNIPSAVQNMCLQIRLTCFDSYVPLSNTAIMTHISNTHPHRKHLMEQALSDFRTTGTGGPELKLVDETLSNIKCPCTAGFCNILSSRMKIVISCATKLVVRGRIVRNKIKVWQSHKLKSCHTEGQQTRQCRHCFYQANYYQFHTWFLVFSSFNLTNRYKSLIDLLWTQATANGKYK